MILVTVGSSANGFDRIVRVVDELKGEGKIKDKVLAQTGNGSYKPKNIEKTFKFKSWNEINKINEKADMVISHAGAGTIMTALRYGKPIICVPRIKELGEHTDNHQLEIAGTLKKEGKILVAKNKDELVECVKKVKKGWKPRISASGGKASKEVTKFIKSQ
jgi:UDP-N-acetylglucosamine transferase subunit ALG13